jgi:hypothetical protein
MGTMGVRSGRRGVRNKIWAKVISFFGAKLAPVMDKVATGMDAAGAMATGAGLDRIGEILHKGSDLVDEAEDIPRLLAKYTEDGDLTADEIKSLIENTGEVGVAFKNVILTVKKKE